MLNHFTRKEELKYASVLWFPKESTIVYDFRVHQEPVKQWPKQDL